MPRRRHPGAGGLCRRAQPPQHRAHAPDHADDLYVWHGYTDIWLGGAWVKATPAFNLSLCERFGLLPLDFDGRSDSIYHPFDKAGNRHMEYVNQRGAFDDMPLARIVEDFRVVYPRLVGAELMQADFAADVARETG